MTNRITPENIQQLQENEVFAFGSNKSGYHGAGAAYIALKKFGAIYGQGVGIQGMSYAIPTKSIGIIRTLTLQEIQEYVDEYIEYAINTPNKVFLTTEIGCGLAGLTSEEVAPLFIKAIPVQNIHLPERFWKVLNKQ